MFWNIWKNLIGIVCVYWAAGAGAAGSGVLDSGIPGRGEGGEAPVSELFEALQNTAKAFQNLTLAPFIVTADHQALMLGPSGLALQAL